MEAVSSCKLHRAAQSMKWGIGDTGIRSNSRLLEAANSFYYGGLCPQKLHCEAHFFLPLQASSFLARARQAGTIFVDEKRVSSSGLLRSVEGEPGVLDESWPAGHEALEDTLSPRREKFVLVDRQVRCDVIMAHQVQVPQFLLGADAAVSQEFAKIALDRIVKSDAGARGFAKAARVLQVSIEEVEQAVAALTTLFARAVRLHLQHVELLSLFSNAGFEESTGEVLADMFAQRHQELFGVVALSGTSYGRLDWRLDIQVASRSVRQQAIPRYLLALQTTDGMKHIEADYSVLKDVCLQLEAALAESRSSRSRRFLRVFR